LPDTFVKTFLIPSQKRYLLRVRGEPKSRYRSTLTPGRSSRNGKSQMDTSKDEAQRSPSGASSRTGAKRATIWIEKTSVSPEAHARIAGSIVSLILLVGIPAFVFWPVLFNSVPVADISFTAKLAAGVSALLGWWFAIVSHAASAQDLEKVLASLEAGEVVLLVLILPFMLWIGTKSVLRRCGWL
jgi:hypothetical protein